MRRSDENIPKAVLATKPAAIDVLIKRAGITYTEADGLKTRWSRQASGMYNLSMVLPDGRQVATSITAQGALRNSGCKRRRRSRAKLKALRQAVEVAQVEAALDLVAELSDGEQRLVYKALKLKLGE